MSVDGVTMGPVRVWILMTRPIHGFNQQSFEQELLVAPVKAKKQALVRNFLQGIIGVWSRLSCDAAYESCILFRRRFKEHGY